MIETVGRRLGDVGRDDGFAREHRTGTCRRTGLHQVVYIVSAQNPVYVDIFYHDQDPALFSDYSHDPLPFTPQVHADIAPGNPWSSNREFVEPR